ncbi:MAG: CHAD domain-containing protein [Acidimicrobiia bacterium]
MTSLAAYVPVGQGLAAADERLRLGQAESLGAGLKRVSLGQFVLAAKGFFAGEEEFGLAVHESRKAMKRVRALLRLVRFELSDKVFGFENQSLRDIARTVTPIREAAALVEAATLIRDLYGDLLASGTFDEMIVRLVERRDRTEARAIHDPKLVGRLVRDLERAHNRFAAWPTDPDAREVYGLGIRDSYTAIRPGLHSTYTTGRQNMVRAYDSGDAADFHSWRKRVKDLRHQMEFLVPLWPETVVALAGTLNRLGELLGEDHDLAALMELLADQPDLAPNSRERSLFSALANQRRRELQFAAEVLGRRVYAENPVSLTARFGEYWESRSLALGAPVDTVFVY